MKKIKLAVTAIFVMLGVHASLGQASISLGLKAGLNLANVNATSATATFDSRTGYHAGAFLSVKLTKLAIQPEIIYSQQGTTASYAGTSIDQNFSYMNIPIMLKFYLVSGLNLQAGPQFGFLTSATGSDPTGVATGAVDVKSYYKSSDFSIGLGAGFDIKKLSIDARYNLGISEVNDAASVPITKNQVFQVSLGLKLFKFGS